MAAGRASLPAGPDLRGVLAITPQARPWKVRPAAGGPAIAVSRTQLTVLPRKQGTLHGVQGKTADPGFIVHWTFPPGLKKPSIWLAYYACGASQPAGFCCASQTACLAASSVSSNIIIVIIIVISIIFMPTISIIISSGIIVVVVAIIVIITIITIITMNIIIASLVILAQKASSRYTSATGRATVPCTVLLSLCHLALFGASQPVSLCPPGVTQGRLQWLLPQSNQRPHLVVSRRAALKPKTS